MAENNSNARDNVDKGVRTLLSRWNGGMAQVWHYECGHRRLDLRLTYGDREGNLHLRGAGCDYISGPTAWDKCSLSFVRQDLDQAKTRYFIIDENVKFVAICSVLDAAEHVKPF